MRGEGRKSNLREMCARPRLPEAHTSTGSIIAELGCRTRFLTVRQLAEILQMHEQTIYRWIRRAQIPFLRVRGGIRLDPRRIAQWLHTRELVA
jgi:excisionase family DNA binding protein